MKMYENEVPPSAVVNHHSPHENCYLGESPIFKLIPYPIFPNDIPHEIPFIYPMKYHHDIPHWIPALFGVFTHFQRNPARPKEH
jgi:hypothetical protein